MAGGAKVNDLDPVRVAPRVNKHDVLGLEVSMNQSQLLELPQGSQHLLSDGTDVLEGQRLELVLLEEVVEVLLKHLKHQAGVVLVLEALKGPHEIVVVAALLTEALQDGHLNLTLAGIRRVVLENLDGHDLAGALLPAFTHLPEGAATQKLQHLIRTGGRVQHFMLNQVVIALTVGGAYGLGSDGSSGVSCGGRGGLGAVILAGDGKGVR